MDNTKDVSIDDTQVYRVSVVFDTHVPRVISTPLQAAPRPTMARAGRASMPAERLQRASCHGRRLGGLGADHVPPSQATPTYVEGSANTVIPRPPSAQPPAATPTAARPQLAVHAQQAWLRKRDA